jgi:hypothetical protein
MGTMTGTRSDADASLIYAKRGVLPQICEARPISRLPESMEQLKRGAIAGRLVIDFNLDYDKSSDLRLNVLNRMKGVSLEGCKIT